MANDRSIVADVSEQSLMEPGPSGMQKEKEQEPGEQVNGVGIGEGDNLGDDSESGDEYNVEAIRAKRINPKTGILEYLIKWENYPEAANSWEPSHHVNCPDLILKFEGKQDNKRKRRRTTVDSQTKRTKNEKSEQSLLVEDEQQDSGISHETLSTTNGTSAVQSSKDLTENEQNSEPPVVPKPKGFERALPIERILGSCTDDNDKIWFFVKWVGMSELELVEASEMEDKAPKEMCLWYRERLYHTLKSDSDAKRQQQQQQQSNNFLQMKAN